MSTTYTEWQRGDKAKLARLVNISPQYLNDFIKGRKSARPELAKQLEEACAKLGVPLARIDFLYPTESDNPLIG